MLSTVSEGPATRAGVRSGDRLVWINGAMVSTLTHSAISKMVSIQTLLLRKSLGRCVCLCMRLSMSVCVHVQACSSLLPHV